MRTAVRRSSAGSWSGAGLGILLGDFGAWLLIGIGAGFILMALIAAIGK